MAMKCVCGDPNCNWICAWTKAFGGAVSVNANGSGMSGTSPFPWVVSSYPGMFANPQAQQPGMSVEEATKIAQESVKPQHKTPDYLNGFAAGVKACKEAISLHKYDMEKLGRDWSPRDVIVKGE